MARKDSVTFAINGKVFQVNGSTVTPETTLNTFIRDHALLKGTKYMCREGHCGACVVTMQYTNPATRKDQYCAVNSCLVSVLACQGVSITTVEGLGNKQIGYHEVQTSLAAGNGTQCGYCSPGMVMNMYSLLKSNPNTTEEDVERSFGGNICRCTGYRPILQAFRNLVESNVCDIEDSPENCRNCSSCPNNFKQCKNSAKQFSDDSDSTLHFAELALIPYSLFLEFQDSDAKWYKVASVFEIMQVLDLVGNRSYMLLAGGTSRGLPFPFVQPAIYVDIKSVKELQQYKKYRDRVVLGANMTLTDASIVLKKIAKDDPLMFGYMNDLADHIQEIANLPVRNIATIAGNLAVYHSHTEFPSDVFLILETAGAKLRINESRGTSRLYSMMEFLQINLNKKLITSVELPAISSKHYVLKTYKVMPRKQSAHALVGAGFLFRILNNEFLIEEKPKIIFTGIGRDFQHCPDAESIMTDRKLFDPTLIKDVMAVLSKEIQPEQNPLMPSIEYRRKLACSMLYKFMLYVGRAKVSELLRSGGEMLTRPISSAVQDFTFDQKSAPVGQPLEKLEALNQCAGEAQYVDDIPKYPNELFAAFVLADETMATIREVDARNALAESGIVAYYGAADIPGVNSFGGIQPYLLDKEEVFCSGKVQYAGQPVGILVGNTVETVKKAVKKVIVKYSNKGKPFLNVKDVVTKGDTSRIILQMKLEPTETKSNVKYELQGEMQLNSQYHHAMELHSCLVVPTDFGFKVYPTTQWIQSVQTAVAQTLGLPENAIDVEVKRIGGGFGSKLTRSGQIAAACSLAAYKLNVPVRMVLDMETIMRAIGKRYPILTKYQVQVDENGVIQKLDADLYEDYGISLNDPVEDVTLMGFQNCYDYKTWTVNVYAVKTDNIRTYARSPGSLEGYSSIEYIMDHIAQTTGKDPMEIRLANVNKDDIDPIQEIVRAVEISSNYRDRVQIVETINKGNRWRKRGIAFVPMKFMIYFAPSYYGMVSIFPGDGTIAITTGGIEMGQGLNTKAAQVCAWTLGVDLNKVKVVASQSLTSPGNFPSGSSITSDSVCAAVISCCEELKRRFEPLKSQVPSGNWMELIKTANGQGISLIATHTYSLNDSLPKDYAVYGATVLEVEVDVLTGQYQVLRADILEDAGESLNPLLDIGQVEGGFMMGLGYFGSEELKCDPTTGAIMNCTTWEYWPPGASDIPIDFRVTLRKNSPNPLGVLRSKATGEPPLCMAYVLPLALRKAIAASRRDAGINEDWFEFGHPCTFENVFLTCGNEMRDYQM